MHARILTSTALLSAACLISTAAWADPPQVEVSGFVDGSVTQTFYAGDDAPDESVVGWGVDQVELDFDVTVHPQLNLRLDLNWMPQAGVAGFDDIVEQSYIEYFASPSQEGFFLIFGKRNAPVGAEALDAPDMYQYSHNLLFDFASPSNLTGLFLGYQSGDITGQIWVANGWDMPVDAGNVHLGGRFDYALSNGGIGVATTFGSLTDTDSGEWMADVDFNYDLGSALLFAELNIGMLTGDVDDSLSFGFMAKAHVPVGDCVGLTARVSYLSRYTDGTENLYADGEGNALEFALAGLFTITDNFGALFELRVDKPLIEDVSIMGITPSFELTGTF